MPSTAKAVTFFRQGPLVGRGARPEKVVFAEARAALTEIGAELEYQVKRRTKIGATGQLRARTFSEVRGRKLEGLRAKVANPSEHAAAVEYGRGRNKKMPPWKIGTDLFMWVKKKVTLDRLRPRKRKRNDSRPRPTRDKRLQAVSFLIARKIARDGIRGRFMFKNGLRKSRHYIKARLRTAGGRIAGRLNGG